MYQFILFLILVQSWFVPVCLISYLGPKPVCTSLSYSYLGPKPVCTSLSYFFNLCPKPGCTSLSYFLSWSKASLYQFVLFLILVQSRFVLVCLISFLGPKPVPIFVFFHIGIQTQSTPFCNFMCLQLYVFVPRHQMLVFHSFMYMCL